MGQEGAADGRSYLYEYKVRLLLRSLFSSRSMLTLSPRTELAATLRLPVNVQRDARLFSLELLQTVDTSYL